MDSCIQNIAHKGADYWPKYIGENTINKKKHHKIKVNLLIVYYLLHEVGSFLRSPGSQLLKFTACYGTRRFINALTSTHHLSLAWAKINPVQWPPIPLPEDTS